MAAGASPSPVRLRASQRTLFGDLELGETRRDKENMGLFCDGDREHGVGNHESVR